MKIIDHFGAAGFQKKSVQMRLFCIQTECFVRKCNINLQNLN